MTNTVQIYPWALSSISLLYKSVSVLVTSWAFVIKAL